MIINWYTANIEPGSLSRLLRTAYVLWLWESLNCDDEPPSLSSIKASPHFDLLSENAVVAQGARGIGGTSFVIVEAGSNVETLFGAKLVGKSFEEILSKSGQALAEETVATLREKRRPVHLSVAGSDVVSKDIEVMQMPLRHEDDAAEMAILVYDF